MALHNGWLSHGRQTGPLEEEGRERERGTLVWLCLTRQIINKNWIKSSCLDVTSLPVTFFCVCVCVGVGFRGHHDTFCPHTSFSVGGVFMRLRAKAVIAIERHFFSQQESVADKDAQFDCGHTDPAAQVPNPVLNVALYHELLAVSYSVLLYSAVEYELKLKDRFRWLVRYTPVFGFSSYSCLSVSTQILS